MRIRTALALLLSLPAAGALAAAPPKPVAAPVARITDDQVRGWESVGKAVVGLRAMRVAQARCKEGLVLDPTPEQIAPVVEAAVGAPLATIEAAIAAPGWIDYAATERVDKLQAGGACDADSAGFIGGELGGIVQVPVADLRPVRGLAKVPADQWAGLVGLLREHSSLVLGQATELTELAALAREFGRVCPSRAAPTAALIARADAETARLTGLRTEEFMPQARSADEDRQLRDDSRRQVADLLKDFGGCDAQASVDWLGNTSDQVDSLIAKGAAAPPLTGQWLKLATGN